MKGSWRTTAMGYLVLVGAVVAIATSLLDSNPDTNPDWASLINALHTVGLGLGTIGGFFGLKSARDDSVSSEEAGAK